MTAFRPPSLVGPLIGLITCVNALDNGFSLPALGFSTWNHFGGSVTDALLRELADAMVSSGLRDAGYVFLNLDDGWACCRDTNGNILPDPKLFPNGMKAVADYIHSRGLKMGIYTARGSSTCLGKPGSDSHELQDAQTYAEWGMDYLKEDSCGGTTHGTVWQQYALMRDALKSTGRPIYFSVTEGVDWTDGHPAMHCYGDSAFTVIPWLAQGLDPTTLANSYLVEYCNNMDFFGYTDAWGIGGQPSPGGFLSNLDSQQLLTFDNLTVPGAFNDNDMLEVCNGGQSTAEYRSQFSTWSILASPLILGNDPRSMDQDCLGIITNRAVISVNQDPLVRRGKLVYQWPEAVWPNVSNTRTRWVGQEPLGGPAAPLVAASLIMAPCNASDPAQSFHYNTRSSGLGPGRGYIQDAQGRCLTYGGYREANTYIGDCIGWTSPGIGSQEWNITTVSSLVSIGVCDNAGKVLDVFNCNVTSPSAVQVCTAGADDCYAAPAGPPGCGTQGQVWHFDSTAPDSAISSPLLSSAYCIAVAPPIPSPVDIRLQVWAKPLVDGSVAALAFNRSPEPQVVNMTWSMLGLSPTASATVVDLWNNSTPPTVYTGSYTAKVQPHDVVMIKATPM